MASTSGVTRLPRGGEGVPRLHPVVARGLVPARMGRRSEEVARAVRRSA
jgi:hypothetical protein